MSVHHRRRVVITGLGIVSPVGNFVAEAWQNVVEGHSGIQSINNFDSSAFATQIAGEVRNLDLADYISPKEAKKMDRFIHYGMVASIQAINDANITVTEDNSERIGIAIGAGIGGISTIEKNHTSYLNSGPRRISPFFVPGSIINMAAGNLSVMYGIKGPNFGVVTACTTATHNIGMAAKMIAYGEVDIMIAGGTEHATTPVAMGGFNSARALSTRNDEPATASRPWDKDRDGFVLSDGAGIVILEELESAKQRGANIYAELVGFGMSGDAYHMTSPPENGEGAGRCMKIALNDAQLDVSDIDYINAHGTSTPLGDKAEAVAIKSVFGDASDQLLVSSTKSVTGHLLGAAGGIEAIFSVLSIQDGIVPPTINLDSLDIDFKMDFVPHEARKITVNTVMSNSFGFGGTNGTLIFKKL